MRKISETSIFNTIDSLFKLRERFSDLVLLKKYVVPYDMYVDTLSIFKLYKYPLTKKVIEYATNKKIGLILFADPVDKNNKPIKNSITSIPCFTYGATTFVDISAKASYKRNELEEPIQLSINERYLFSFFYIAFIYHILIINEKSFEKNNSFLKSVGELYTILLAKVIDKTYPISSERDDFISLYFILAKFFANYLVGMDNESSIKYASSLKIVDEKIAKNIIGDFESIPKFESVDELLNYISNLFSYFKDNSFKYRNILFAYNKMYGQNSLLCIENIHSFLYMIFMSNMRTGLFNDRMLTTISSSYVDTIEKSILEIVATL